MVERATQFDIVTGYRAERADAWYRSLNSRLYNLALQRFIGLRIRDVNCAFKLYRREVFDRLELRTSGALINAEIFAKAVRQGYTPLPSIPFVLYRPRTAGSPTGAKPKVILKAFAELWTLWREMQTTHAPS